MRIVVHPGRRQERREAVAAEGELAEGEGVEPGDGGDAVAVEAQGSEERVATDAGDGGDVVVAQVEPLERAVRRDVVELGDGVVAEIRPAERRRGREVEDAGEAVMARVERHQVAQRPQRGEVDELPRAAPRRAVTGSGSACTRGLSRGDPARSLAKHVGDRTRGGSAPGSGSNQRSADERKRRSR